jgi:hypothetical protein
MDSFAFSMAYYFGINLIGGTFYTVNFSVSVPPSVVVGPSNVQSISIGLSGGSGGSFPLNTSRFIKCVER